MNAYSESLLVHFRRVEHLKKEVAGSPSISLNERQVCDLELLCNRAFYPLTGFMTAAEYESVLDQGRLPDSTLWPLPICLDVNEKTASRLEPGQTLGLCDGEGFLLAVMHVQQIWQPDKRKEAARIYGTEDANLHPSVYHLFHRTQPFYVGGSIEGLHPPLHFDFPELRLPPSETHRRFTQMGWRNVIGFHTEKPLHCAHKEMILHAARQAGASIFLQPEVGRPSPRDLEHFTMIRCYQAFVRHFPQTMIMLGLLPYASRKAGPKEALLQAIIRKNYGCTHFIVAPDQSDPFVHERNDRLFYPAGKAQELVAEHSSEIGIQSVPLIPMVYVEDKAQYLPETDVGPDMVTKRISSAELRRRLEFDLPVPEWFSFPEVVGELKKTYPPRHKQGFTIFLTGLSGSGKSTLARILYVKFMELRDRPVTLLDGDIVRTHLSSELSFSREHREINVRRIGYVASEITKNRGIAICAPIAPYEESRRYNRELISQYGGYIEVYMNTPFEVCEQRDRKGLYAKARQGLIKGVTGVDDPYIPPANPDLSIDTSQATPAEAVQEVLLYLSEQGYVH
ncbi:MAG: bifunctional sulfate adenylyltransferase/adenylylsulfate kinase [Desulfovermiculus sp.]